MSHKHRPLRPLARRAAATAAGAALALAGLAATAAPAQAAGGVPRYDHVVLVMEENHSYDEVIGSSSAPYINNTLAAGGASFTQSFAIEHPSEPNYLDLFSGSNQGVTDDSCPHTFSTANEGAQLIAAGDTFAGYSEGLPSAGSTACTSGAYARKHAPWVNFSNVPAADNLPFTSFPSSADYASLPTVSWVIPNLNDDMHDGTVAQGDTWLHTNLDAYAQWAKTHNSLLVVTWDEDDSSQSNQIPTIFYGANVKQGTYSEHINHYNLLRTIEDMYGLPYAGAASSATPITDVFNTTPTETVSVTNPGSQTSTAGTAISTLQISATDSAGKSLTYSATGLPAGLSISASGAITGTPTTAGTSSVTVTASSGTASGSTTFSWTVNPVTTETVSVTNPGSQTSTAGTAISTLQISATDSAGKSLTYSATGLPAGLSISSSGAITGTPTTAGTSSVTVTASSGTASGSTTFSWTVNPVSGGCTAAQLLGNPGFETGSAAPWTASSGVIDNSSSEAAHSGSWKAWLDGYGSTHTDTLSQTVTVPTTCTTATFSFFLHIDTSETTTTTAYDKLNVQVLNSSGTVLATLATYSNLNAASGYVSHSFNLNSYIGQTITLKFTGTEDSSLQTSFVVDDTALTVN
ncbi:alkaline phosphatase family protein [Catenulispora subtropica]|uniref:phospholipase C n=1 Tax=Catenulispora subtropica TaxID=450798 RepID=A0ABN2RHK3_9ACTN